MRLLIIKLLPMLFMLLASSLEASGLYQYPAINLDNGETVELTAADQFSVAIFFEPACGWCAKQTKVFNQYLKRCGDGVNYLGLGVNGNRQQLKKTAWRLRAKYPVYMAGPALLEAIGEVSATPLTLILDPSGNVLAHARGYLPFNKWQAMLAEHTGVAASCKPA